MKKIKNLAVIISIISVLLASTSIGAFATDGYEFRTYKIAAGAKIEVKLKNGRCYDCKFINSSYFIFSKGSYRFIKKGLVVSFSGYLLEMEKNDWINLGGEFIVEA